MASIEVEPDSSIRAEREREGEEEGTEETLGEEEPSSSTEVDTTQGIYVPSYPYLFYCPSPHYLFISLNC